MKTTLLISSLMIISAANSHFNCNQFNHPAASSHQASDPATSSYYNHKPAYHYYPMTFFSQSPYSYQTNSKPMHVTTHSPANPSGNPYWYRHSASKNVRPGAVYEYQYLGPRFPHTSVNKDRSLYLTPQFVSPAQLDKPMDQVEKADRALKVADSHLIEEEGSGDPIQSDDITTDATTKVSTETDVQDLTNLISDEGLLPRSTAFPSTTEEDVTTPLEEEESSTMLNDITTLSETESPISLERHQTIIPFYLRPSAWRARSFGPNPSYYQPNHYYGPEEARDLPSSHPGSSPLFV